MYEVQEVKLLQVFLVFFLVIFKNFNRDRFRCHGFENISPFKMIFEGITKIVCHWNTNYMTFCPGCKKFLPRLTLVLMSHTCMPLFSGRLLCRVQVDTRFV